MDCLKNLTACMGCTKKHAKCAWREVQEEEMLEGREESDDHEDLPMTGDAQDHEERQSTAEQPTKDDDRPVNSPGNGTVKEANGRGVHKPEMTVEHPADSREGVTGPESIPDTHHDSSTSKEHDMS